MKYIDADKLKAEIERRITDNTFGAKLELIDILAWLDTLESEKPMIQDEDFRREMREWVELMVAASFPEQDNDFISEEDYRSVIKQTARHFAQWQKEQMMKEAVEGDYDCQYCAPAIFLDRNLEGIKDGDRVRVIVCKKED